MASPSSLGLDDLSARLARHPQVAGALLIGSVAALATAPLAVSGQPR